LEGIPYSPWLRPLFAALTLVNLASVWLRGRSTGLMRGFYLVSAGTLAIFVFKLGLGWENAAFCGVALTLPGSLLSALSAKNGRLEEKGGKSC
jgi:hypothetical protein